ncbi:sensor histidine kinase [Marinobacterium rhizophilum]|uniref:histidine kinase n=1 Tax=Marinobacterium rhizophilum TaxID=420402 RepID=A0ABY5HE39_9GAMM|nr:sensor histidine kinase [Marinobacterium rhizophilum]UTW10617.1 sensor histidine kinase [Marinobacterium rhizophilum]
MTAPLMQPPVRRALGNDRRFSASLVAMLSLLLILVLAGGSFAYIGLMGMQLDELKARQNVRIERVVSSFSRELGHIRNLTSVLKNNRALQRALAAGQPTDLDDLAASFLQFAQAVPAISQVRWLDRSGQEQVRINVSQGRPYRVGEDELQNKAQRYYFQEALRTPPGQVYLSQLDLNLEHNEIVRPFEPSLRATLLTGDADGLHAGVLIININLAQFFQQLRSLSDSQMTLELVDAQGYWLLSPDQGREWGLQLDRRELNMANLMPALWALVSGPETHESLLQDDRLWTYAELSYDPDASKDTPNHAFVLVANPSGDIAAIRWQLLSSIVPAGLLLLLLGLAALQRIRRAHQERAHLSDALEQEQQQLLQAYTRLEQSHQQLHQMQDELVESRRLSSLGLMVAGVAHELNTPTGGALMAISTLQTQLHKLQGSLSQGMTRSALETFLSHTESGLQLADHNLRRAADLIRSFKRMAVDRSHSEVTQFELAELTRDLTRSLSHHLKKSPVNLRMDVPESLQLTSYPGILSQVLQNLIENALKHAFAPGHGGHIHVRASRSDDRLQLSVSDDGQGIDPQVRDAIFDPFVTSGRSEGHTGLGLHLVHQWVYQLLEGTLSVESDSTGTTFSLDIPVEVKGER